MFEMDQDRDRRAAFGVVARRLRVDVGLPVSEVADRVDVPRRVVRRVERGAYDPPLTTFWAYANAFGLPLPELARLVSNECGGV